MSVKKSIAEQIKTTKVLLSGLKGNQDVVTKWGIDPAFVTDLEKLYQETLIADNDQQALKSRLKEKTALIQENLDVLRKQRRIARNMVKDRFPQESWKEFGIEATK